MNKLTVAALALLFAVLGGCASTSGDVIGTGAVNDASGPYPRAAMAQVDE